MTMVVAATVLLAKVMEELSVVHLENCCVLAGSFATMITVAPAT